MRNFQMKGRRCAPACLPSLRVTRGLQPVCRPFYLSLGYSDVALAIAGFHVDRRGRDRAQGQEIMIVALGKLHPASNCAGTFFPMARLVKIIASHSKGLLHFHIWYTRDQSLKAERDKAAQQVNAFDTAIRALSGMNSTGATRGQSYNERRCTSKNFGILKSTLGTHTGPEGCLHCSQASHFSSGIGED